MQKGAVKLEAGVAAAIARAAQQALPCEMVGVLGGSTANGRPRITRFVPLSAADCRRDRFHVPPAAFAAAEAALRADGLAWLGFVHSHPRGDARPSATDERELWRGCVQLVVGLGGQRPELRAFMLDAHGVRELRLDVCGVAEATRTAAEVAP